MWGTVPPNVGFHSPHRGGNSDLYDSLWHFDDIFMSNMRYDSPFSDDEIFSQPLIWTYCILFCFYSLLLHLPTKNDTSSSPNRSSNHLGTISKTTLCQKDYYHSAATTISTKSKRNGPNSTGKRRRTASDTLNTHIIRLTNGTNFCSATPPGASASLPLRCATIW